MRGILIFNRLIVFPWNLFGLCNRLIVNIQISSILVKSIKFETKHASDIRKAIDVKLYRSNVMVANYDIILISLILIGLDLSGSQILENNDTYY